MSRQLATPSGDRPRSAVERGQEAPSALRSQLDEAVLHDLLNPMTAVLGQLELLQDLLDDSLDGQHRRRFDDCLSSARELSEMLVNLRCLTQIRAGEISDRPVGVPLPRLLAALQDDDDWPCDARVRLSTPHGTPPYVRDVAGLLARSLHVLVHTARRLSGGSPIYLDAQPLDRHTISFTCRYIGTALPEDVRQALFAPEVARVQREHRLRVDRARGMELVRSIMQLLEGAARYEPTADGGRFILIVPQAEAASAE